MKRVIYFLIGILFIGCSSEDPNVVITGEVKGLKKGTLYLERAVDTSIVILDSMLVNGEPEFVLKTNLKEPEVLFIRLDIGNEEEQRLRFFADSGTTFVNTTLKRFIFDAKIEGSEQQKLLNDFDEMMQRFSLENLDLIKAQLESGADQERIDSLQGILDNLQRRKYLFAVNYALQNKDKQLAPYIALSEIYDANPKLLDTIYQALDKNIMDSKYGKELKKFISKETTPPN